jgi:pilus assembly protein CpaE
VLDLNFQNSAIPEYLEIDPRFDIVEVISNPARLDDQLVTMMTSKHASGVDFLVSRPSLFDYATLDVTVLFGLLDQLAKQYDVVLVDIPPISFPWIENLLLGSDAILVVGTYSIPSVKRVTRWLDHLREIGVASERLGVVVNESDSGMFGRNLVSRSDINEVLTGVPLFYVRRDVRSAGDAVNSARSIVQAANGRGILRDLRRIAEWIDKKRFGREKSAGTSSVRSWKEVLRWT